MGNICSWCYKTADKSELNSNPNNHSEGTDSNHGASSLKTDDRTPLLGESDSHNYSTMTSIHKSRSNSELTPVTQPCHTNEIGTETRETTETAESRMAVIVDDMLSKLIDVSSNALQAHHTNESDRDNARLKQTLTNVLTLKSAYTMPDAGLSNLSSLLSERPVPSDLCRIVARTADQLSNLLINEFKIIHKENIVVIFA